MINNRDCFFYKKSDFINRLQDLSPDSVCYIADTQQIYTHGRYFECNVTQDIVEQLIQNHGYLTAADLPVLTGGASPTPDEYVTGVSVGGHNINVQKGKLSEINVGSASKLETPRKIELSGDLSGSIMFDGSQDVNIETIVHNSTTADRLTTPRTISLSSQATGQVSFDGSGNVDIPVTVNELDSKNANNRDLNSLVTLNGYGGNLFYGIGGNTSTNKPSGIDWFGLLTFKSASGNYTTQILGSNNRLYSRSNADTSLGSWNTIAYLTDNVASATKLQNTRTFTISDGTNSGTASNFDGTGNVTLRLPGTINANIIGNVTGDIVGDITGDLHGNADTATKLQTGRNINGTLFDGTQNITTAQWGTARNLTIGNSTKSVNGSANVSWTLSEIGAVNKAGDTITGTLNMQAGINLAEADGESWHLHGIFATNDWWDIAGYSTAKDDGYLDIRTGDNGDEGIRVSQWDSSKLVREAWLLNSHGNTIFPGIVVAPTFSGALSGNASTASRLATARTISLTGDASGSASFDGSANISIPVTIANDSHTHATSASSNATTNLTITAGGTTATVADLYATYADQLRTARTISLTGDVTGSTSFNGTGNVSIAATVANNSHTHTFANISDKPLSRGWSQNNNNNITTAQFLDLLKDAGAFKYGWFHARGLWSYAVTSNITDTGYGILDLAGCAITVWGSSKNNCTVLVIPPLNSAVSSSVELGTIYLYINNGEDYLSGWRKIARFEDIDWNNITNKPSSFTPSSHTHPLSQISNLNANWDSLLVNAPSAYLTRWPSISEVTGKQNFVLKLNGGTTEGTNQFTYNGTAAKTLSITPSSIGAATSSHSHSYLPLSGGTLTGKLNITYGVNGSMFDVKNTSDGEVYFSMYSGDTWVASVTGNHPQYGAAIYNGINKRYLGITASGIPHYQGNALLHAGNYTSYTVTKTGSGASGTWPISISGTSVRTDVLNDNPTEQASNMVQYVTGQYTGIAGNTEVNGKWGAPEDSQDSFDNGFQNIQILRLGWSNSYYTDLYTGPNNAVGKYGLQWRQIVNNAATNWRILLDSSNYTSYTVTKTGSGASGTWGINISGKAANADTLNNEVIQYVSASRGIPYRFSINRQGQYRTYIKLGTLPLPADVGSGESKVIFFVYGGMNFGDREESVHVGTVSTRGSVKASLRNIIGKRELQIGCVTTDSNVEVWLHHTNNYLGTTTIDVVASSQFSYTMQPTSSAPANVTWLNSEQVVTTSDLAAVATSGNYNDLINKPNIPEGTEVDTALSSTSVNPVQNKVITSALNGKASTNHTHSQYLTSSSLSGYATQSWVKGQGYLTTPYTLPTASSSVKGGITLGYSSTGKNYAVALDGNGRAYVNVPWTDNNTTYSPATASVYGLVKIGFQESGKNYPVELNSSGQMYVNVPWTDTNTTYGVATTSSNGLMSAAMVTKLNGIATGANNYTHPSYTARSSGLYKITIDSLGHVSSATAVSKNDIVALGIPASDTNTHYTTHLYAGTSSGSTNASTSNGGTHLILTDDSTVRNRVKLTGSGATSVSSDASGNITISSTNTTYGPATTSSAGLMSAADKAKLDGIQASADAVSISRNLTSGTQIASITINGSSTALYAPAASTSTDTKNTTGTSNSTSKLYLAGGTTQSSAGVQTYSNVNVYTQSGQLYATRMNATNGFYETSDARLKDFKDDIKALDVVSEIPTKYFTWKSDESKTEHIGTSAQEIQKLYPDLVTENEDGVLSVDYARLSIIALAAIKELKAQIDELKSKN